ncbi:MAG TPA: hypothetical protein VJB67_00110, partial [Patescibacteria group bacterium]|nr:hypothetical protein [Patescibacteria group bacterium]
MFADKQIIRLWRIQIRCPSACNARRSSTGKSLAYNCLVVLYKTKESRKQNQTGVKEMTTQEAEK